jgi:hypothetical protein
MKFFSAKNTAYAFHVLTISYALITVYHYFTGTKNLTIAAYHDTFYVGFNRETILLFFILHIFLSVIYQFVKPKIHFFNFLHLIASVLFATGMLPFFFFMDNSIVIGGFYLFATICFLINVTYTLITLLIKPK